MMLFVCCFSLGALLEGKCKLPTLSMHARQSTVTGMAGASPLMALNLLNIREGCMRQAKDSHNQSMEFSI